jgi:predicted ABC-class ATPase
VQNAEDLQHILRRIDGRGYPAYKDLRGVYDFGSYLLLIDHVQGDPFASPSRVRVQVPQELARFPDDTYRSRNRRVGLCDLLTRRFAQGIGELTRGRRGTGRSGEVHIQRPGQEVLERTSVLVDRDRVEARFTMGLPARGRRVMGHQAEDMFFGELPAIVTSSLWFDRHDREILYSHVEAIEDQDALREQLADLGLAAFVPEGAVLPRRSGVDDRPMVGNRAVAFKTPERFRVTIELPNRGEVSGMGIPVGVTLIVGGGYHGKSTLLRALEAGVYNRIPGDGRELVVTVHDAVKIRAEDGRRIEQVDIRPFIGNLPCDGDTSAFSTGEASGSTSQAANIIESLEVGTSLLLIDEDTSATNFMIRDHRMQELVAGEKEPITPFIDKVRQLYDDLGVSTIVVIGGSGDYFDVADRVILMDAYRPRDATHAALSIAKRHQTARKHEGGERFGRVTPRMPLARSIDASRGRRRAKIAIRGRHSISFGEETIDLSAVAQIADPGQTAAIADAMLYARDRWMADDRTMREVVEGVVSDFEREGLDILSPRHLGHYVLPRKAEIAAAINRFRALRVRQKADHRPQTTDDG